MADDATHPVREIAFATDFSESSAAAAQTALAYARHLGARLHLLHVNWVGSDPRMPDLLGKLADEFGARVPVVTAVETGSPAAQVVQYAGQHRIDLIVLGTHGRTGVTRALLGSVAERVIRTAPCPVLTVPMARPAVAVAPRPETMQPGHCAACALPSEDLICGACRARIRGEAVGRKQREERPGRS
jgi:nucleotide-binding universal stress UspA family protein